MSTWGYTRRCLFLVLFSIFDAANHFAVKGSPHWDNNFCRAGPEETKQKEKNARAVPLPECDPIFGPSGPLVTIWREAMASA